MAAASWSGGLASTLLFLRADYSSAFLVALGVTQGWRVISEFFRDDHRGVGRFSAYQVMGVVSIGYGFWVVRHFGGYPSPLPELARGLASLWSPASLLLLQLLWILIFLYTGLSRVTAANMSFHVNAEKV